MKSDPKFAATYITGETMAGSGQPPRSF
jgi:hypothetical protein